MVEFAEVSRRRDLNCVVGDLVGGDAERSDHPQPGNPEERPQDPLPSAQRQACVREQQQRKHHADNRGCPRGLHQHGERPEEQVAIVDAVIEHCVHEASAWTTKNSAVASRIQPIPLRGCRRATTTPTSANGKPTTTDDRSPPVDTCLVARYSGIARTISARTTAHSAVAIAGVASLNLAFIDRQVRRRSFRERYEQWAGRRWAGAR